MIYRKPDGGLEKQYRDKGGRAVWERSSMANLFTRVSIRKFQDKKIEKKVETQKELKKLEENKTTLESVVAES